MVEFYADVIGLETLDHDADRAVLGVDDRRLVLLAAPDRPPAGRTGLFHTAFRGPPRTALGDALTRIEERWRLDGASDHHVSEAVYLSDPEDNGIDVWNGRTEPAAGRGLAWVELVVDDPEGIQARLEPAAVTDRPDRFDVEDPDGITIRVRRS